MKKIFLALLFVLALVMVVKADDVQYWDQGFREKNDQGFWYFSSNKEIVFVCDGAYITFSGHASAVKCPSRFELESLKREHGKKFRLRMKQIAALK